VNSEEYDRMYSLEDTYWWYVARRELALKLIDLHHVPGRRAVDVGCGTGALLAELCKNFDADGFDLSTKAIDFCRERGLSSASVGNAEQLPAQSSAYDLAVTLDLLEHVDDDVAAIGELHRILAPGGLLVINVPAFRWLWGPHDVALHHHRRYTARELRRKLLAAGFTVERMSYSVFLLFGVVVFRRLLDKFSRGPATVKLPRVSPGMNAFLLKLMRFESRLLQSVPLPFGSSVVAVARKK